MLSAMLALATSIKDSTAANLIVGHVNHRTRGAESDEDSKFVKLLAKKSGLDFYESVCHNSQQQEPSEESLRNFRYEQLLELAAKLGARYIVTGHNFDDQVETILFRIFRGTGIAGLAGIPKQRLANESVTIVRPLLDSTREQIIHYLHEIGQSYRTDCSNADSKFARNYLRNELLPELKARFGDSVSESIARLGSQASEFIDYLDEETEDFSETVIERTQSSLELNCHQLKRYSPIVIRHGLIRIWTEQNWPRQSMTFQWWQKITQAIQSESDLVLNLPCSIRFEKTADIATFSIGRGG